METNHWFYLYDDLYVCGYCGGVSTVATVIDNKTGLELHRKKCPFEVYEQTDVVERY
jgi:hypothetical protein